MSERHWTTIALLSYATGSILFLVGTGITLWRLWRV